MSERRIDPDRIILERESELASIDKLVEAATSGNGSAVVLEGHAGVGKTLLLEAAIDMASRRDVEILIARGTETEREFSFGVVLQLFQRALMSASPEARQDLVAGAAALAEPLLDGTKLVESQGPETAFATHHGLYWFVSNLADRRPLVLAIDDAQWADVSSLQFLSALAHRLEGLPVAVVQTRRLGEFGASDAFLESIKHAPATSAIRVEPLSDEAVAEIVRTQYDASSDDAFCEACAMAVGGNPLYLRELLKELRSSRVPPTREGAELIPQLDVEGLARSVRRRLHQLGPDAAALADAISVADGAMTSHLVADLAGLEQSAAEAAARVLSAADIVTAEEPWRFVHPLLRNAVYKEMLGSRRATMHRRAAELFHDEGVEPERIAGHLNLADGRGEVWAVQALQSAALKAIERGDPGSAVTHLRRALEEGPPSEQRLSILTALALAEAASDKPSAMTTIEAAAAELSGSQLVHYLLAAINILFLHRRYDLAFDFCRRAVAEVSGRSDDEAGFVFASITSLSAITVHSEEEAVEQLRKLAATLIERGGPLETPGQRIIVGVAAGVASLRATMPFEQVRRTARHALATAAGEEIKSVMFQSTMALTYSEDYETADAKLTESIDAARRRGFLHDFTAASVMRAEPRYRSGDIAAAMTDAEAALEGARQGLDGFEPPARAVLALCLLDRGDLEAADQAVRAKDPERWAGLTHVCLLHEARGHVLLAQGRARDALEAFREAGSTALSSGATNPTFCAWRSGAALAAKALGDTDEAQRLASEEVAIARSYGAPRALGIALRAQGLVVGGERGAELLDEAVAVLADSPARLEHARALLDRGAARRRAGQLLQARDELRLALDQAVACGAHGLAARARDELAAAGGRPRRERVTGPASLTPQERRIADLVAEGLSNREIAQALFLTRKTIETHLTNVYAKLGIRSREELAPVLREDSA